jgi:hypothetical protein
VDRTRRESGVDDRTSSERTGSRMTDVDRREHAIRVECEAWLALMAAVPDYDHDTAQARNFTPAQFDCVVRYLAARADRCHVMELEQHSCP